MPNRQSQITRPRSAPSFWMLTTALLIAACGSAEDLDGGPGLTADDGPRVADVRFEGDFLIEDLVQDGTPFPLATTPAVNFETVFGGLTVKPGCNTYFGSFTLAEDGTASITIAGGSREDCGDLDRQEDAVVATLGAVSSWVESADGFRFDGPGGDSITLSR